MLAADCEPETAEPSGGVSCLFDNFLSQEIALAEDCEPEPEMTVLEEDRYDSQALFKSSPMPPNKLVIIPTDIDIIEIEIIYNMYKNSIISFYESMTELHGCIKTWIDIDFSMNHALDNISSNEVIKHMFSHTDPYIVDATNFESIL